MTRILLFVVRAYQFALSPLLGNQCRFAPTCSQYAVEAIERFGPWRGAMLALGRVLRCHPWHAGGWDPVPALRPCATDQCSACGTFASPSLEGQRQSGGGASDPNTNL